MDSLIELGPLELALATLLIAAAGVVSLALRLGVERRLGVAALRTVIQLGLLAHRARHDLVQGVLVALAHFLELLSHIFLPRLVQLLNLLVDLVAHRLIADEKVDEPRAGDIYPDDAGIGFHGGNDAFGQVARFATGRFCERHREIAGKVAMRPVAGALHHDVRRELCGQAAVGL